MFIGKDDNQPPEEFEVLADFFFDFFYAFLSRDDNNPRSVN